MNKLLKFISLITILTPHLSLSCMEQKIDVSQCTIGGKAYPISITSFTQVNLQLCDKCHVPVLAPERCFYIKPNQILVFSHTTQSLDFWDNHIEIMDENIIGYKYKEALALAQGQKITVEFLQKHNLINTVYANADACHQNGEAVKDLTSRYIPIFINHPEKYTLLARGILQNIKTQEEATAFMSILGFQKNMTEEFFEQYSYSSAFIFSLSHLMPHVSNFVTTDHSLCPSMGKIHQILSPIINLLVELAMRVKLQCYCEGDETSLFEEEWNLTSVTEKEMSDRTKSLIDNDIIIFTMCEARELLKAIDTEIARMQQQK